ncbi:MAG: ABC transporter permease [Gammaproteobacteria bacterium]
MRSILTGLGIAIGIASVVLLTSIGEGIHQFVLSEFTQFGTNLIGINPGKATTAGASIGVFGTERPLTLGDAEALSKLPLIKAVVPLVQGNGEVKGNNRKRRTMIIGVGPDMPEAFSMNVSTGRFLPRDNPDSPRAFVVLGNKVRKELYGESNPLGERMRIGGHRYTVVGSMASKGQVLGFDLDDTVYIPASRGLEMFNREGLIEIDLLYKDNANIDEVVAGIKRTIISRHGRDDVTITTQQQMLDVLGSVLSVLTFAVGAIGGISLLVGSVGIITIMTIAVQERTPEIGLLRALGSPRSQILTLFLGEATVLAMLGGVFGLVIGVGGAKLLSIVIPGLPVNIPWIYVISSEALAIILGLLAGVIPAKRAAHLDPIESLRYE